jgi:hypothetical protein
VKVARPAAVVVAEPLVTTAPFPLITLTVTVVDTPTEFPFASTVCKTGCVSSGTIVSALAEGSVTNTSFVGFACGAVPSEHEDVNTTSPTTDKAATSLIERADIVPPSVDVRELARRRGLHLISRFDGEVTASESE